MSSNPLAAVRASSKTRFTKLLAQPSWSVRSLGSPSAQPAEPITAKQLHHLLRLAALPLPQSAAEEASMLETLQAQLRFVQAVQSVDTSRVEPLRAIRDETREAMRENTIALRDVKALLDREELVGHFRRPRRVSSSRKTCEDAERWHVLGTAGKTAGRYFVVESAKQVQEQ